MQSYLRANARWLERKGRGAFVGAGAEVAAGVEVMGSVIGAGARLGGKGAVRGCVVWPGARAEAPIEGAVVTARGITRS
ncbi:MAG: hypothetical protein IT372_05065 [Polyangiaceae bacterium]|nr:hypothetical protein [Polyangiaceae bacterium]